jgi:flagellar basal-body rod protein FlgB
MPGKFCPAAWRTDAVPVTDIPIFSMLRTRMQWHQDRQRILTENVANADTPKFKPRDLAPLKLDQAQPAPAALGLARTNAMHLGSGGSDPTSQFGLDRKSVFETRPAGNAVSLEDEMMKVAANQMDYQAATALYARGLGLIKTALGKR